MREGYFIKLYFVRHGETECNVEGVYYGWTDCGLNEKGIEQAEKLHGFFKEVPIDSVIVSPLKRAMTTAEIILKNRDITVLNAEELKEINFGEWEGKKFSAIAKTDSENYQKWCNDWQNAKIPGGESFLEFYERVTVYTKKMIGNNMGKDVLVISHNGVIGCMLCFLIGVGAGGFWRFHSDQNCYSLLSVYEKGESFDIVVEKINSAIGSL